MTKCVDFSKYSNIHIGGVVEVEIVEEIRPINGAIIGGASNTLISPNPPKLYMLGKNFDFINLGENFLHVGCAAKSGRLLSFTKKHDIGGFELLQKLPGTLGGIIKMNAGLKEWEIFNNLLKIRTDKGWIEKSQIEFGYRFTKIEGVIFEALFEVKNGFDYSLLDMFEDMRLNQPLEPSLGSCFKNPVGLSAGKLLEDAGFRGKRCGDMAFSEKHANFLVNLGNGTFEEAMELINEAKQKVFELFGITLELEIKVI